MKACLIFHNMIVEDERDADTVEEFRDDDLRATVKKSTKHGNIIGRRKEVRNPQIYHQLKEDLVEHIWKKFGHFQN